jgi:cell fate (sporulation/competence/biofilm development) regulator YlbF (YheA/YmcA/DUF963 family)
MFMFFSSVHQVVETTKMSRATLQIPYIFHRGREITDSELIMEYLEKEMDLDATEGLSAVEQAVSRAFTAMVNENTMW